MSEHPAIQFTPDELTAVADALDWYDDTFRSHPDYESYVAHAGTASAKVDAAMQDNTEAKDRMSEHPTRAIVRRYWLDTEFIEDGRTIDLISIGVVCDDGREFYAESTDIDLSTANEWVQENVLPHLWHRRADKREANAWSRDGGAGGYLSRQQIARDLVRWVAEGDGEPEFWAYYADYDWVVLCQLFGRMLDLPVGWPMFCMDIKQEAVRLGNPRLPEQSSTEHHALADARWNREAWEFLAAQDGSSPS